MGTGTSLWDTLYTELNQEYIIEKYIIMTCLINTNIFDSISLYSSVYLFYYRIWKINTNQMWYKQNAAHNNKYQINTLIRNCCRIIKCHVTVVNYKTVEWVMFHTYLIRLFVLAAMKWKPEAIVRDCLVGDSNSWRGCVVGGAGESEREDPFNDRHQKETTIRLSLFLSSPLHCSLSFVFQSFDRQ